MTGTPENPSLSFSMIIPSKNEANDIGKTLEACLAVDYPHKEIIVVDDSTDETPNIVRQYAAQGVKLIHRDYNANGCCGARNLGMQTAQGDIIVIINADARPSPDFIRRLIPHYEQGADWVVVRSKAQNKDNLFGRYIYASELAASERPYTRWWSEGFSCRRSAAEAVGYIPGDFPVPFCRDFMFGIKLQEAGYVKHQDLDIVMEHVCPSSLQEYWGIQVHRGAHHAPLAYYFRNVPYRLLLPFELLRAIRILLGDILVFPLAYRALRYARHTGWRHFPHLLLVAYIRDFGQILGSFKGLGRLRRNRQLSDKLSQ